MASDEEGGRERFDVSKLEPVDEDHPGVKLGIFDSPIVDRGYDDGSGMPTSDIEPVDPGMTVVVYEHPARVSSTSRHGLDGDLFQIGFYADFCGTVCSLWVDRNPYLLDVCNGGIYAVDPDEVRVRYEVVA